MTVPPLPYLGGVQAKGQTGLQVHGVTLSVPRKRNLQVGHVPRESPQCEGDIAPDLPETAGMSGKAGAPAREVSTPEYVNSRGSRKFRVSSCRIEKVGGTRGTNQFDLLARVLHFGLPSNQGPIPGACHCFRCANIVISVVGGEATGIALTLSSLVQSRS